MKQGESSKKQRRRGEKWGKWERGKAENTELKPQPTGAARVLPRVTVKHPKAVLEALRYIQQYSGPTPSD